MREAGATAAQELAFTLADAIAYCEAAVARGLDIDDFAGRLSFFFAAWKPAPSRANGTASTCTPCSGQRSRRRLARTSSRHTPRSKCRQTDS